MDNNKPAFAHPLYQKSKILEAKLNIAIACLKKIAWNENTMDDTTYCVIAEDTLKELGIK